MERERDREGKRDSDKGLGDIYVLSLSMWGSMMTYHLESPLLLSGKNVERFVQSQKQDF